MVYDGEERRRGPNRMQERRADGDNSTDMPPADESKAVAMIEAVERSRDRELQARDREQALRDKMASDKADAMASALEKLAERLVTVEAEQDAARRREARRVGAAAVLGALGGAGLAALVRWLFKT